MKNIVKGEGQFSPNNPEGYVAPNSKLDSYKEFLKKLLDPRTSGRRADQEEVSVDIFRDATTADREDAERSSLQRKELAKAHFKASALALKNAFHDVPIPPAEGRIGGLALALEDEDKTVDHSDRIELLLERRSEVTRFLYSIIDVVLVAEEEDIPISDADVDIMKKHEARAHLLVNKIMKEFGYGEENEAQKKLSEEEWKSLTRKAKLESMKESVNYFFTVIDEIYAHGTPLVFSKGKIVSEGLDRKRTPPKDRGVVINRMLKMLVTITEETKGSLLYTSLMGDKGEVQVKILGTSIPFQNQADIRGFMYGLKCIASELIFALRKIENTD